MADTIHKKVKVEVTDGGSTLKVTKRAGELDRNMKGLDKTSSNAAKNFSKMSQGMEGVLVPAYARVAATVFAATAAFQQLSKAAELATMKRAMQSMAQNTGKNLNQIAKEVQKASGFMLSFADAARQATLAATAGFQTKNIIAMTKAARKASLALGRSFDDTFDRIFRGVTKAEPELLDELGIILRLDTATKKYAEKHSLVASELNIWQRQQAVLNDVLEQTENKFEFVGDQVNSLNQLKASWIDLKDTVMEFFIGVLQPVITYLANNTKALAAFSAIFALSTIRKAFPALQNIFKNLEKSLDNREKKLNTINKKLLIQKTIMEKQVALIKKQNIERAKAKVVQAQQAFGAQLTGTKATPALRAVADADVVTKKMIRAAEQSLSRISKRSGVQAEKAKSKFFLGGALKGKPLALIHDLNKSLKAVAKSNKDLVKETKSHKGITGASGAHVATKLSHAFNKSQQLLSDNILSIFKGFTIGHSGDIGFWKRTQSLFQDDGPRRLLPEATPTVKNTAALERNTAALLKNTTSKKIGGATGGSDGAMIYGKAGKAGKAVKGISLMSKASYKFGAILGIVTKAFTFLASKLIWIWGLFEIGKMAINFLGDRFQWLKDAVTSVGNALEFLAGFVGLGALFEDIPKEVRKVRESTEDWSSSIENVDNYVLNLEKTITKQLNPSLLEQKNRHEGVASALDSLSVSTSNQSFSLKKLVQANKKVSNSTKQDIITNYNKTITVAKKLGVEHEKLADNIAVENVRVHELISNLNNLNSSIQSVIAKEKNIVLNLDLQIAGNKELRDYTDELIKQYTDETKNKLQRAKEITEKKRTAASTATTEAKAQAARAGLDIKDESYMRAVRDDIMSIFPQEKQDEYKQFGDTLAESLETAFQAAKEAVKALEEQEAAVELLQDRYDLQTDLLNLENESYKKRTKGNELKYKRAVLDTELQILEALRNETQDKKKQDEIDTGIAKIKLKITENEYNWTQLLTEEKLKQQKEDEKVLKIQQKKLDLIFKELSVMNRLRALNKITANIGTDLYEKKTLDYDLNRDEDSDHTAKRAKREQQILKVKATLKQKIQASKFELKVLKEQKAQGSEVQTLLDYREKVLELQRQHNREETKLELQKLITAERQLALAKLRFELEDLQLEKSKEKAEEIKQVYDNIAESFGTTISDTIYNALTGEKFDWKKTLSDKLMRIGSDLMGSAIQEGVFGKDGLMGSLTKGTGLESILFPESDVDKNIRETKDAIVELSNAGTKKGSIYTHDEGLLKVAEQQLTLFDRLFNAIMDLLERNRGGNQYEQDLRDYQLCQDAGWEHAISPKLGEYCTGVHQNMSPMDEEKYYDGANPGRSFPQLNQILEPIKQNSVELSSVISGTSMNVSLDSNSISAINTGNIPTVEATDKGTDAVVSASNVAEAASRTATTALLRGQNLSTQAIVMAIAQQAASDFLSWAFSANGNVLKGGFRAFAKGGVVNKPTLGLVGEGKHNEAVVPLPDGRSIPVSGGMGDMNTNITVNVEASGQTNVDVNAENKRAEAIGKAIEAAVTSKILEEKRPGGALSPY